MSVLFYWTGALIWGVIVGWSLLRLIVSWAQVTSYFLAQVIACTVHKRWRTPGLKPFLIPSDFLTTWWDWAVVGAPDRISSQYMVWEGTFKWAVYPYKEQDEDSKSED